MPGAAMAVDFVDLDVSALRFNTIVTELGLLPDGRHNHHGLADRCWSDRYEAVLWRQLTRSLGGDAAPERAIVSGTWVGIAGYTYSNTRVYMGRYRPMRANEFNPLIRKKTSEGVVPKHAPFASLASNLCSNG
jgi:hypothetical protein